ncbi:hypothetical protein IscW_ISCW005505 [Ixodes scapularis]|uniref:Reverse transcriptase n=1 Tax=Ixodes scapularis TaxID=6945 RepID=B7PPG0_IXOSC|nr:hypothetical protein IscW_ISCW005505 [Ixodes scapularis]|eukprot:XP_002435652.1 hypothetical protein IscW_ISCW005505 [Ixodes scapularis]
MLGEFIEAVESAKTNTSPGPNGISVTALQNLLTKDMKELLQMCNDAWDFSEIPAYRKRLTVLRIPKGL